MQRTEVVLFLGIGVAVGWLVLDSSPATRTLESASIDIPMSPPPEGSLEAPAEETLEPEILLVRMAASEMPPERVQPQEEEEEKEKRARPRSRRGGDGPPLADAGVQTGSESEGQTEPVSPATSSGATTTTGGSGSSGGVGGTSGGSGGGGSGSGSGGVSGGGYGGGGGGGS